jgi:hypothetical protein
LVQIIKTYRDQGSDLPALFVNGQPAELDRIVRYCKQEKILSEICGDLSIAPPKSAAGSSPTNLSVDQDTSRKRRRIGTKMHFNEPERPFSIISNIGRVEIVLLQTRTYLEMPSHTRGGQASNNPPFSLSVPSALFSKRHSVFCANIFIPQQDGNWARNVGKPENLSRLATPARRM